MTISFGTNLRILREKRNLSQEDLARKLQISRQSISKWEQGISYPSILYLVPLTKILDCTLEELLKGLNIEIMFRIKIHMTHIIIHI